MAHMPRPAIPAARPICIHTPDRKEPNSLPRKTLDARNIVIVTDVKRKQLAQVDCGLLDMNWWSFRQTRRQMEKKGRRQPLNTCATKIT